MRKVLEQRFVVEAWKMLAYTLNADERYEEALPYYDRAIHRLEEIGEQAGLPGRRSDMSQRYFTPDAIKKRSKSRTAEEWFKGQRDALWICAPRYQHRQPIPPYG